MKHLAWKPLLLAGLCASALACGAEPLAPASGSNVILIVVDTLRADATDGSWTSTPELARLAGDGVRFEKAFSQAPSTLPSHTALFSSRAPNRTGVLNNGAQVPEDLPLLAEHLLQHGYATHAVVSLGTLNPRNKAAHPGLARGFLSYDMQYWHMDSAAAALERMRASLNLIDATRPFFFFAHFSDPHSPYSARDAESQLARFSLDAELIEETPTSVLQPRVLRLTLAEGEHDFLFEAEQDFKILDMELRSGARELAGEWLEGEARSLGRRHRYRVQVGEEGEYVFKYWLAHGVRNEEIRGFYRSEVEYVDAHVALFLAELDARGWYDESLVVFTSDHGEALGNPGFAGHIENLRDEMLHVPLMIKLPATHRGAARLQRQAGRLVSLGDLTPTILEVIGLPALHGQEGRSLLQGRTPVLIAETHRPEARRNYVGLRDERYKMIHAPDTDRFFMFDMLEDPTESQDIFGAAGRERSAWPAQLRQIARNAAQPSANKRELTQAEQDDLQALGYVESEEE